MMLLVVAVEFLVFLSPFGLTLSTSTRSAYAKTSPHQQIQGPYADNRYPGMENGKIAVWISPDGSMQLPTTNSPATFRTSDPSYSQATQEIINRNSFGVAEIFDGSIRKENKVDALHRLEEFVPLFRREAVMKTRQKDRHVTSRQDSENCQDCYSGLLTPSITYEDGSDIFKWDFPDWSNLYPTEFDDNIILPNGCYYESDVVGHIACNDSTIDRVPKNLTRQPLSIFDMSNTSVTVLYNGDFSEMRVVEMRLFSNPIETIRLNAFRNVIGLAGLYFQHNMVQFIDWSYFDGLDELQVLSLRGNRIGLAGKYEKQSKHPSVMHNLTYLDLAENPLVGLDAFVFWQLRDSPIEELNLKSCNLNYISEGAFDPLTSLLHVDLYNNPMLLSSFLPTLKPPALPPTVYQVGLGYNRLAHLPTTLLQNVTESLKILNLSGNFFIFLSDILWPECGLPALQYLIMESCSVALIDKNVFRNMSRLSYIYLGMNQITEIPSQVLPPSLRLLSLRRNPAGANSFSFNKDSFAELPYLTWLDMNYMKLDRNSFSEDVFNGVPHLTILQMRESDLSYIPPRLFSPLLELLVLDLGGNSGVTSLPNDFSVGLNKTLMLFLDWCSLDFPSGGIHDYQPFRWMSNLYYLYLGFNNIYSFTPNLIASLTQLTVLDLSQNMLSTWILGTTANMPADAAIDASDNKITYLPNQTFEEFSRIKVIDLSDNALTCICQTMDLQRLATSSNTTVLFWEKQDAYKCIDTSVEPPVEKQIPLMPEEAFNCEKMEVITTPYPSDPGKNTLLTAVSSVVGAMIIVVLAMTIGGLYFRRKNQHRNWFYFNARRSSDCDNQAANDDENHNEFEYDAFVSFNEQDRPWVYTHLVPKLETPKESASAIDFEPTPSFRLCLHDRDFTVGQRITENIVENVAKSRKVVIVLSRSYVESKWCQFELDLSHHRLLEDRRGSIVLILLEDVPKQHQNATLRYLISTRTYLAWRNDLEGQQLFWQRLRQVLETKSQNHKLNSSFVNTESVNL